MSIRKNHPAIERGGSLFTASAGLYPKIGGRSFNYITKPDFLNSDKSRQAHSARRVFALVWGIIVFAYI
ncbi:hypothetical protein NTG1052_190004 [Candidatus Nitrotoga sp. 1052]|nr:hypothetical protein NTG1052_190004 [Candidatus Nitrotoga sp. 1052]